LDTVVEYAYSKTKKLNVAQTKLRYHLSLKGLIMEIKEAYKQKMAAQLKEWSAQINLLEAKAENVGAGMKVRHAEVMLDLQAKQRMAIEKMNELESASSETWDQVKETSNKIWNDLKTGIAEAHSKFK
jgi:uncharacterized protein YfiM (DUF2279 family)